MSVKWGLLSNDKMKWKSLHRIMFVLSTYATFLFSLKGPVGESSRLTGIQFSSAAAERKSLSIGRVLFSVQFSFNPGEEPCSPCQWKIFTMVDLKYSTFL